MSTADEQGLRTAFHPSASIVGHRQGAVEWLTVDAYVHEVVGAGLPPDDRPDWRPVSLDVTNDAAVAKLEDEFGSMRFTDYLSLLRSGDRWTIVGKLYHLPRLRTARGSGGDHREPAEAHRPGLSFEPRSDLGLDGSPPERTGPGARTP